MSSPQPLSRAVAVQIRLCQSLIFDTWVDRALTEVVAASAQTRTQLIDHLPDFLNDLADQLDPDTKSDCSKAADNSKKHGSLRAKEPPSYTVREVLKEYRLLREVMYNVLEIKLQARLDWQIRDFLAHAIEQAMECAAEAFSGDRGAVLMQAKDDAETSAKGHERLVTTLSHDLRNPLGAALMGLSVLESDVQLTPDVTDVISVIRRNLVRADMMLHDLLDVARVNSGHQIHLRTSRANLGSIAKESAEDMELFCDRKISVSAEGDLAGEWDHGAVRRLFDNLLSNAIKYGDKDEIVKVFLTGKDDNVQLAVHNAGEELSLDAQKNMFEPFWRSGAHAKSKAEGWGLGLSLVDTVAKAHGGSVSVQSGHKAGTTFKVLLPRKPRPTSAMLRTPDGKLAP